VAGATDYCWTFTQGGATVGPFCSTGTTYQLPARPGGLEPGLVTVTAEVAGPFGTLSDDIQISLYRTNVINTPKKDHTIGKGALRVGVFDMVGATQYCFRLVQTNFNSGPLCYGTPGHTFNKNNPIWDSLSPGPLTVDATIYAGDTVLAMDTVSIDLL